MTKIAHITDTHFDHLVIRNKDGKFVQNLPYIEQFARTLSDEEVSGVILTGDITMAPYLERDLKLLQSNLGVPVWYVHGNHDFYYGNFKDVWLKSQEITKLNSDIVWLDGAADEPISLTENSCLVGVDGWYDIQLGLAEHSRLRMTDFDLIENFRLEDHMTIVSKSRQLAFESAEWLREKLLKAIAGSWKTVYVATHVPPFAEASLAPDGSRSDSTWAPYMSNSILGTTLKEIAKTHPEKDFKVLCGHTHTPVICWILRNLEIKVGKAEYGKLIYNILDIE